MNPSPELVETGCLLFERRYYHTRHARNKSGANIQSSGYRIGVARSTQPRDFAVQKSTEFPGFVDDE